MKSYIGFIILCVSTQIHAIEFTVHHGPGGPSDRITRLLANELSKKVYVVNRPGARGQIATKHIIETDSIMVATIPQIFVTNFLMPEKPSYNEDDLEIIYVVAIMPQILVCHKQLGIKTYKEFLSYTKPLNFGVAGYGSAEHLSTEFLFRITEKNYHKIIPYPQGGSTSLHDLLAGHIDCMFANYPLVKEYATNHNLNVLISTHNINLNIPHWKQIYGDYFQFESTLGLVISKNMNKTIKEIILKDLDSMKKEKLENQIRNLGLFPIMSNNKKDIDLIKENNKKIREKIKSNNLRLF
jgi:tripartite-type tricarboxylate transporter receptor subunit TctC